MVLNLSMTETRYVFVTGGMIPSQCKAIVSASLARLLLSREYRVTIQRLDPHINIDMSMLDPYEYGECYVTADGYETDLNSGHYERFTDIEMARANNVSAGRVYQSVMNKERRGDYKGKAVKMVPHVTDEIKCSIVSLGDKGGYDFVIAEVGGAVNDLESMAFVEAVRQLNCELKQRSVCIHMMSVPSDLTLEALNDAAFMHSVETLQERGIEPDVLVLCSEQAVEQDMREEIARLCKVDEESVVQLMDSCQIYEVPLLLQEQDLDSVVLSKTEVSSVQEADLGGWKQLLDHLSNAEQSVKIGLVARCAEQHDAYKSISESLFLAAAHNGRKLDLHYICSEDLNDGNAEKALSGLDGVVVAPDYGQRGVEGKLVALKWCRENDKPTLGIGLGMQCMAIEIARNVLGLSGANSTEMDSRTPYNVIDMMREQKSECGIGGPMRLGSFRCVLQEGSRAAAAYGATTISERHRHSYELNNAYREHLESAGMKCTGINPETGLVEVIELPGNRWYVGTQYHLEYNSTVLRPNPLLMDFVREAANKK